MVFILVEGLVPGVAHENVSNSKKFSIKNMNKASYDEFKQRMVYWYTLHSVVYGVKHALSSFYKYRQGVVPLTQKVITFPKNFLCQH